MWFRLLPLVLLISTQGLRAQALDSLVERISLADTTTQEITHQLDSIQSAAGKEYNSLKHSYDSVVAVADVPLNRLNKALDSLKQRQLPTDHITHKIDSIQQWKDVKLSAVTEKVDGLKAKVNDKIGKMDMPPSMQAKAQQLSATMDVKLPTSDLPASVQQTLKLDLPSSPNIDIGKGASSLNGDIVPGVKIPDNGLGEIGGKVQEYQSQVPTDIDGASTLAEAQAAELSGVNVLTKDIGQVGELKDIAGQIKDPNAVKEEAVQQAVNHFAGKEEQLQKAMETVAKYKKKYGSLESLSDIPKRRPNEMHGKPLRERLLPGINLQIFRRDDWLIDFNPYVGYRFNGRLTVGLGWNQRVAYNFDAGQFNPELRIYGPRTYGEFKVGEGFSGHLELEYMNTYVPPRFLSNNIDTDGREWVFSTMAGIKKEYKFIKNVKGTFMILYNLYDPYHKSPYIDRLNMRMGFEFPMKASVKK